jgi:hypothetical protein
VANWQAPSTNNERAPDDIGGNPYGASARPYIDSVSGHVKWWSGNDALPVGATPLYVVSNLAGHRVFSTDSAGARTTLRFGNRIILR